jgi:hypothetical protein
MTDQVPWGSVVFHLNHDEFRKAFADGRRYYFEDIHNEHPDRAIMLTATDAVSQIAVRDQEAERYHFDLEGIDHPVEFLGIFLGYTTAPLFPETPEEREQRLTEKQPIIAVPEAVRV